MSSVQAVTNLETVIDLGGRCDWCDDPLEPGDVVSRRPDTGKRVHQEGCLADQEHESLPCRRDDGASSGSATSACSRCFRRVILRLRRCTYPV